MSLLQAFELADIFTKLVTNVMPPKAVPNSYFNFLQSEVTWRTHELETLAPLNIHTSQTHSNG